MAQAPQPNDQPQIYEQQGGYYLPNDPFFNAGGGGGEVVNPPANPNPSNGTGGSTPGVITPTMAISPNTHQYVAVGLQRCFTAIATVTVPQEDLRFADFKDTVINGCSVYGNGYYRKNCGSNGSYDTRAYVEKVLYKFQPGYIQAANSEFNVPGGSLNNHSTIVGIRSLNGYQFFWEVYRYCNSTINSSCTSQWFGHCKVILPNGTLLTLNTISVNFNENFRMRSDGTQIIFERSQSGVFGVYAVFPIPNDADDFQFYVDALFVQNTWTNLVTFRGSWQGQINVDWSAPDGGTLTGTGNSRCFSSNDVGEYSICIDTPFNEPLCVPITVEPLYFRPIDYDCGDCVFAGSIIRFESNAPGTLTANSGTVLDSLTWQAPDTIIEED